MEVTVYGATLPVYATNWIINALMSKVTTALCFNSIANQWTNFSSKLQSTTFCIDSVAQLTTLIRWFNSSTHKFNSAGIYSNYTPGVLANMQGLAFKGPIHLAVLTYDVLATDLTHPDNTDGPNGAAVPLLGPFLLKGPSLEDFCGNLKSSTHLFTIPTARPDDANEDAHQEDAGIEPGSDEEDSKRLVEDSGSRDGDEEETSSDYKEVPGFVTDPIDTCRIPTDGVSVTEITLPPGMTWAKKGVVLMWKDDLERQHGRKFRLRHLKANVQLFSFMRADTPYHMAITERGNAYTKNRKVTGRMEKAKALGIPFTAPTASSVGFVETPTVNPRLLLATVGRAPVVLVPNAALLEETMDRIHTKAAPSNKNSKQGKAYAAITDPIMANAKARLHTYIVPTMRKRFVGPNLVSPGEYKVVEKSTTTYHNKPQSFIRLAHAPELKVKIPTDAYTKLPVTMGSVRIIDTSSTKICIVVGPWDPEGTNLVTDILQHPATWKRIAEDRTFRVKTWASRNVRGKAKRNGATSTALEQKKSYIATIVAVDGAPLELCVTLSTEVGETLVKSAAKKSPFSLTIIRKEMALNTTVIFPPVIESKVEEEEEDDEGDDEGDDDEDDTVMAEEFEDEEDEEDEEEEEEEEVEEEEEEANRLAVETVRKRPRDTSSSQKSAEKNPRI
jgi:hypothetical protein